MMTTTAQFCCITARSASTRSRSELRRATRPHTALCSAPVMYREDAIIHLCVNVRRVKELCVRDQSATSDKLLYDYDSRHAHMTCGCPKSPYTHAR